MDTESSPTHRTNSAIYLTLALLCSVQMMLFLDDTVVNVALPTVQRALGLSEAGLTWIINAYLLTFGGFLLLGGRCADLYGPRRIFLAGVAVFALASLATGLAQNAPMIIGGRVGQGIGGALASPAALTMVAGLFTDPKARSRALGIWAGLGGLAATLGVVLSGVLTEYLSWRWCFLINVPVAILALATVPRLVPARGPRPNPGRVDGLGAAAITGAATASVLGFIDSGRVGLTTTALRLALGAVLLVVFLVAENRHPAPLIPLAFFRDRNRAVANIANIAFCSTVLSMLFFLTLYLQQVLHLSPARTGAAWLPFCATVILGFAAASTLVPRLGVRALLVAALTCTALAMYLLSRLSDTGSYPALLPGLLVAGLGMGLGFVSMTIAAVGETHEDITGLASGLVTTTQQLGGAIGLGAIGSIAIHRSGELMDAGVGAESALTQGFHVAFLISAVTAGLGAVIAAIGITRDAGVVDRTPVQ